MRALLFLLLLAPSLQDDPKAVIDAVDKALGDFQDADLSITTSRGRWYMDMSPSGPARLRIARSGDAALDCPLRDGAMLQSLVMYSMRVTGDGYFFEVRPEWTDVISMPRPLMLRAHSPLATLDGIDPLLLPTCYPVRLFMDDSLLFYALAPKRYLALEKDLAVLEKRADGTVVLVAKAVVKEPIKAIGIPFVAAGTIEKRFFIRENRVDRVTMRIDLGRSGYSAMIVSQVHARNEHGLPTKTSMRLFTLQLGRPQHFDPVERTISWKGINTGLTVEVAGRDTHAWAEAALRPLSAYKGDDAVSLASSALTTLWMKRMIKSIFQVDTGESNDEKAVAALEKLRELKPADDAVALTLAGLVPAEKAEALLKAEGIGGTLWRIVRIARGKPFSAERLESMFAAAGVKASDLGINDWMPITRAFGGEEFTTWARTSGPAALRAHIGLAQQGTARLEWMASAIEADPKNVEVRRTAVMIACVTFHAAVPMTGDDGKLAVRIVDAARDPVGDGWRLIAAGKPDASCFKDAKAEGAALLRFRALGLLAAGDPAAACAAAEDAARRETAESDWAFGAESPINIGIEAFRTSQDVVAFGRILAVYAATNEWLVGAVARDQNVLTDFRAKAQEWAAKNPKETETLVTLSRACFAARGGRTGAAKILEASNSSDPKILGALAALTDDADRVYALLEKCMDAAPTTSRILRAASIAVSKGQADKARGFLKRLPALSEARDLDDAAQLCAQAGDHDQARQFARRLEDHARRPFTLYGFLAEAREDYLEAFRWYGRDAREGGDPLERYVYTDDEITKTIVWRGRTTAADARKKLLARLGEDWLINHLLEEKQEPLSAEQEKKAAEAFAGLSADELEGRDECEETLLKLGRSVAPIIKSGLKSEDADVKARVRRILQKLAEP